MHGQDINEKMTQRESRPANNPVWNQVQNNAVAHAKGQPASLRLDEAESGPNLSPIPISIHGSFESHHSVGS
jgi:hypothetical protein